MEPKPTASWEYIQNRWHLRPPEPYPSFDIAVYRPYGSETYPWIAVADFWVDAQDIIIKTESLSVAKEAAERYWLHKIANPFE